MSTLKQRLARVIPYFRDNSRGALALAAGAMVVAAATEPVIHFKCLQICCLITFG